jgi:glycosyltransferase involved in cell wall biosynthesis/2-polyprenyl-3-methyl-5-hydroxy-6-metoxy-1,4-benzoquinol methylase
MNPVAPVTSSRIVGLVPGFVRRGEAVRRRRSHSAGACGATPALTRLSSPGYVSARVAPPVQPLPASDHTRRHHGPRPDGSTSPQYCHSCPICDAVDLDYLFVSRGLPIARCRNCRLMLRNPQPADALLAEIYSAHYFLSDGSAEQDAAVARLKEATARLHLQHIDAYHELPGKRLLEVGCGNGELLVEAQKRGYDVTGVEISPSATRIAQDKLGSERVRCGDIEHVTLERASFDVCVLSDVIEHTRNPARFLQIIHELLVPGGTLFIVTPSLNSFTARLMRQQWMEFKLEHLFYFDRQTIQHLLFKTGYHEVVIRPAQKVLNQEYITQHFDRFPVPALTSLMRWVARRTPERLRRRNVTLSGSGMMVLARNRPVPKRCKLSVVLPVYNERRTFREVMDQLLQKEVEGLDVEVIVVESNSTDGTRQEVLSYRSNPRVTVVLEERPEGKGHAVRTGLQHATGDFVLIQDADLEYDMNDYEVLLEPLRHYREAFVLGSRHGGGRSSWKMRQFEQRPLLSVVLNSGHIVFATLLNLLYAQRLKDPFTMYKVFRRDCLFGLEFECNRFDFDYELVIKLVRKGYRPVEIPINYRSRSFGEGKKVSPWRDPPTWIRALIKYRFARIDNGGTGARSRRR